MDVNNECYSFRKLYLIIVTLRRIALHNLENMDIEFTLL
jgi:hypothetical protein